MTKGVTVEQLGEQNHRLNIALVWSHPPRVEHDDHGVGCGFDELPDHAVYGPMDIQQCRSSRSSRRMFMERMGSVYTVP